MKERIRQLAQGKIEKKQPELLLTPATMNGEVVVDTRQHIELTLRSNNRIPFKGFFYSSNEMVRVLTDSAAGYHAVIGLEVCAENAGIGETIEGELTFVSDAGEYTYPYNFLIIADEKKPILETVEAFMALCRKNRQKAIHLFNSSRFLTFPFMKNPSFMAWYYAVHESEQEAQGIDTFLAGIGAKKAAVLQVSEDPILINGRSSEVLCGMIPVGVTDWGYIRAQVSTDSEWLVLGKDSITEADFEENETFISYKIRKEKLHDGTNIGVISLTTAIETKQILVQVNVEQEKRAEERGEIADRLFYVLYRKTLEYLNNSYDEELIFSTLEQKTKESIAYCGQDERIFLLRAWLFLERKQSKYALEALYACKDIVYKNRKEKPVEHCIYLYLESLAINDYATEHVKAVVKSYEKHMPSMILSLLCLYMEPVNTQEEALSYFEALWKTYGKSPLLYALAARVYRDKPQLMEQPSEFGTQVFVYMLKYQCNSEAVIHAFLRQKGRKETPFYVWILKQIYQDGKDPAVLTQLCACLIRMEKSGEEALRWYEEGIRRGIRLTGLNDAYITSLSLEKEYEIPVEIQLYYSYKNRLDHQTKRVLYQYIIKRYQPDSEMYQAYKEQIEAFATSQLLTGEINKELIPVYEKILLPELIDARMSEILPDLLFAKAIHVTMPYAKKIVIQYPQIGKTIERSLTNKEACVPIYSKYAVVLIEDAYGNRYVDENLTSEPVIDRPDLIARCRQECPNHLLMLLAEFDGLYENEIQDIEQYSKARELLKNRLLTNDFAQLLTERMVDYCYQECRKEGRIEYIQTQLLYDSETENWLKQINPMSISAQERIKLIELYIVRGYLKEAYAYVSRYGIEGIRPLLLLKLAVRQIMDTLYEKDDALLSLCMKLLEKKQYNETTLTYLAQQYNGPTGKMCLVLECVSEQKVEPSDLAERVTAQMLFTGNADGIEQAFSVYARQEGYSRMIEKAYYVMVCHRYLTDQAKVCDFDITHIEEILLKNKERTNRTFAFALLKWYAQAEQLTKEQKALCEMLVYDFCREDLYLEYYHSLRRHIEMPHQMEGRIVLQVVSESGAELWAEGVAGEDAYHFKQPMSEVYPGIYTTTVFLFPDEVAEIDIYRVRTRETEKIKTIDINGTDCYRRKGSRYDQLGDLAALCAADDIEQFRQQELEICRKKIAASQLFTLM